MAKKQKSPKLIDLLEVALKDAGYTVSRNGWTEEVGYDKPTEEEWLDVTRDDEGEGVNTYVHFFFTNNSKELSSLEVFTEEYTLEPVSGSMKKLFE